MIDRSCEVKGDIKLCKDCRFCKKTRIFSYEGALCLHPRSGNRETDRVSGKIKELRNE